MIPAQAWWVNSSESKNPRISLLQKAWREALREV